MEKSYTVFPRYLPGTTKQLFTIDYRPHRGSRGCIVLIPPFAEEMNRSRQMISRQARQFAEQGYRAVVPDLGGTGDSYGDFAESTWEEWSADLMNVVTEADLDSDEPLVLWSIRLGALLGLYAVRQHGLRPGRMILWSPCLNGTAYMTQFLRLRLLSSMIGKSGTTESLGDLKATLSSGSSVEVAGYEISAELYRAIAEQEFLSLMDGIDLPISWFEMISETQSGFPPPAAKAVDALSAAGARIQTEAVVGPKFWETAEISVSEKLLESTLRCVGSA